MLKNLLKWLFPRNKLTVQKLPHSMSTVVDSYWSKHTVNSKRFRNADESLNYLEWRFGEYPLFREFMSLYGNHDGEVVLDYGCGPGNDLVGFFVHTNAKKIIGIDVSSRALRLARHRLALHQGDHHRIELLQTSDSALGIPIGDEEVDYIYCEGVLHHTTNPEVTLGEFSRILKRGSKVCLMVYNRHSLWLHLYTAYQKMVIENAFPGMDILQAFSRNADRRTLSHREMLCAGRVHSTVQGRRISC